MLSSFLRKKTQGGEGRISISPNSIAVSPNGDFWLSTGLVKDILPDTFEGKSAMNNATLMFDIADYLFLDKDDL